MEPRPIPEVTDGMSDREVLISIHTELKFMSANLETLWAQIHGNGQPGIKDRLARLEEKSESHKKLLWGMSGVIGFITLIVNVFAKGFTGG